MARRTHSPSTHASESSRSTNATPGLPDASASALLDQGLDMSKSALSSTLGYVQACLVYLARMEQAGGESLQALSADLAEVVAQARSADDAQAMWQLPVSFFDAQLSRSMLSYASMLRHGLAFQDQLRQQMQLEMSKAPSAWAGPALTSRPAMTAAASAEEWGGDANPMAAFAKPWLDMLGAASGRGRNAQA